MFFGTFDSSLSVIDPFRKSYDYEYADNMKSVRCSYRPILRVLIAGYLTEAPFNDFEANRNPGKTKRCLVVLNADLLSAFLRELFRQNPGASYSVFFSYDCLEFH